MAKQPTKVLTKTVAGLDLNLKVLISVAIVVGLGISIFYAAVVSNMGFFAANAPSGSKDKSNLVSLDGGQYQAKREYKGYIVQLKQKTLVEKNLELSQKTISGVALQNQLQTYTATLRQERSAFLTKLSSAIRNNNQEIKEFTVAFNGVALNITDEEARQIRKMPEVKSVSPNYKVSAVLADSVPMTGASEVWRLDADGRSCGASGKECLKGKGVKIGIIDTGVDYTHSDLKINYAGGYDFVNGDNDPMDDMGHGTHVAAIAAGNGVLKGVAPQAKIIAYKVLDANGSGWSDIIITAIERAIDPNQDGDISDHLDVINLSLGGGGSPDDPMSMAIDTAVNAGVVAAVAAGNWGPGENTIASPGNARNAITVGAIDKSSKMAYFSSVGPVVWQDSQGTTKTLIKPDLVAPGVNICAAEWANAWDYLRCLDDKHVSISGTSMATPHVAGAVALLKQKNPTWTTDEIKLALRSTADNLGADWGVNTQGYGKLNVLRAIKLKGIPSIARIYTGGLISGDSFDIVGLATGRNFDHYVLSYGRGQNPSDWIELKNSTSTKDITLYPAFDTSLLNDGKNYLKLTVYNKAGEPVEDRSLILTDTLSIKEPQSNDVYRQGGKLRIIGSISGKFSNFSVEYGQGENPTTWSSQGITLFNNGQGGKPINNGLIANWDTSFLSQKGFLPQSGGFYTVRVKVNLPDGRVNEEYAKNIYFDETLKVGWPQKINFYFQPTASNSNANPNAKLFTLIPKPGNQTVKSGAAVTVTKEVLDSMALNYQPMENGYYYWAGFLAPIVADINNDKFKEIVVYKGGVPPQVLVYRQNGTLLWSQNIDGDDRTSGQVIVANLDKDDFQEIVVFNSQGARWDNPYSKLMALNHDKTTLWSANIPRDWQARLLAADLNQDGKNEVVAQGYKNLLVLNGQTGEIISQTPLPQIYWSASLESSPAVGNFDDDQDLEIVISRVSPNAGYDWETGEYTNEGNVYIYNLDGSPVSGWPITLPGSISSSPVVGDIDGDGQDNIVIGYLYASNTYPDTRYGGLYALDRSGAIMPGWPFHQGWNFWSTPSLADLDGDGKLEIVDSQLGFETYVLNYQAEVLPGWPQYTTWNDYYGSIIGDINGDSKLDIITTDGNGFYPSTGYHGGVEAWDLAGNKIAGYPKVTESDAQAPAVISDIDNDGKLELIASSDWEYNSITQTSKYRGSIYVWELDGVSNSDYLPWPTFMHDSSHTGLFPALVKLVPDLMIESVSASPYTPPSPLPGEPQGVVIMPNTFEFTIKIKNIGNTIFNQAFYLGNTRTSGDLSTGHYPHSQLVNIEQATIATNGTLEIKIIDSLDEDISTVRFLIDTDGQPHLKFAHPKIEEKDYGNNTYELDI
ncbi:MAG: S8 family serine peptidase [Candidatus Buchananbacteria bacterium]|nr:S8 family serine peptidase [Candidatus Buchananbacteria bacterium]